MNEAAVDLGKILDVDPGFLDRLDKFMVSRTGRAGVLEKVAAENESIVRRTLSFLGLEDDAGAEKIRLALRDAIRLHEVELLNYLEKVEGKTEFEKAANLARRIARTGSGFFLKKEYGKEIIKKCKPENLLKFLGYKDVEELLKKHDVTEIFSALRFIESEEWMHETFEKAYSGFTAKDFEERPIEIKVLGPEWREVAKKFVAKKHHNVSHLKEFGVIFLNPIKEDMPGKFLRDFALLLHYFHEIEFYSKLFVKYSRRDDFAGRLKALLRGDVEEVKSVGEGEWLIVQRYLFKDNPKDPRLFLPRVNPESMHWLRGERDLVRLGETEISPEIEIWLDHDWVGLLRAGDGVNVVSFDLEDNAMALVSFKEGKNESFNYHQKEALWTKLFSEYVGGEKEMEEFLLENFDKGTIVFGNNNKK